MTGALNRTGFACGFRPASRALTFWSVGRAILSRNPSLGSGPPMLSGPQAAKLRGRGRRQSRSLV